MLQLCIVLGFFLCISKNNFCVFVLEILSINVVGFHCVCVDCN